MIIFIRKVTSSFALCTYVWRYLMSKIIQHYTQCVRRNWPTFGEKKSCKVLFYRECVHVHCFRLKSLSKPTLKNWEKINGSAHCPERSLKALTLYASISLTNILKRLKRSSVKFSTTIIIYAILKDHNCLRIHRTKLVEVVADIVDVGKDHHHIEDTPLIPLMALEETCEFIEYCV